MIMMRASAGKPLGIRTDGRFVFTMCADGQGRLGEDSFERLLLVNEQVTGARTR